MLRIPNSSDFKSQRSAPPGGTRRAAREEGSQARATECPAKGNQGYRRTPKGERVEHCFGNVTELTE